MGVALFSISALLLISWTGFASNGEYGCDLTSKKLEGRCKKDEKAVYFKACRSEKFKQIDPKDISTNPLACEKSPTHPTAENPPSVTKTQAAQAARSQNVVVVVEFGPKNQVEYRYDEKDAKFSHSQLSALKDAIEKCKILSSGQGNLIGKMNFQFKLRNGAIGTLESIYAPSEFAPLETCVKADISNRK